MDLCRSRAPTAIRTTSQRTGSSGSAPSPAPAYTGKPSTPHHAEKDPDAGTRQPNRTPRTTPANTAVPVTLSSLLLLLEVQHAQTAESHSPKRTQLRITSSNDHEADPTQSPT
jgi:hypothetical protein